MSFYHALIIEATGCKPEEAEEVEEIMRDVVFHSTLDWQTRAQFVRGARKAYGMLSEVRQIKEDVGRQFGPLEEDV